MQYFSTEQCFLEKSRLTLEQITFLVVSSTTVYSNAWIQLPTIPDDFVNMQLDLSSFFHWPWVFAISCGGNGVFPFFPLPGPWCAWFVAHAEPSNHFYVCLSLLHLVPAYLPVFSSHSHWNVFTTCYVCSYCLELPSSLLFSTPLVQLSASSLTFF